MGLGRRQYRTIGPTGFGDVGTLPPITSPSEMRYLLNGGYDIGTDSNLWLYRGALRIPAVWKATMLVAGLLAQVDWDAFTTHGKDQLTKVDQKPALLEQPSPPDTQFTTFRSGMIDYLHDGNAVFVVADRDSSGRPTAVWPVPASWVGVRRLTPSTMGTSLLPTGAIVYQIGSKTFTTDDIIHIKGPCAPGALRGAGILEMFLQGTLLTAHEQEHEAQKMSRHGVPAGILKFLNDNIPAKPDRDGNPPVSMADRMRNAADQWLAARDHSGVAVMNSAVEFTPLAWNPNDMQMVQARQFTLLQLANIMCVPPKFVGAVVQGDNLTYATSETGGKELLRDTMGSHFTQWEQTLSLALPRGTVAKPNLDSFLRSDMLQRFQAYALGINAGFIKPNADVRHWENWPDMPDLDEEPTASAQKGLNKQIPITEEGIKPVLEGDLYGNLGQSKPGQPVQANAQRLPGQPIGTPQLPVGGK